MKRIAIIFFLLCLSYSASAQLYGNKWRFGISAGVTNYLGDIRPLKVNNFGNFTRLYKRYDTYSQRLSYQASLEYALGNSVGLMLTAGTYQFGAGDRFVQNDGNLFVEGLNFDRALNFQTDIFDTGLSFVFKPDNNWLLNGKSIFAPYFTLGFGVQSFNVNGDLLDENGNRYDYTNPNVIPDGTFETNLNNLGAESPDGYRNTTLYANLGLGFRIRITRSIEFFAQTDFKRAATDYLDDISGVYRPNYDNDFQAYAGQPGTNIVTADNPWRGFENGNVDWYIYHGMGIKFSFGANKEAFNPPVVTQRYTYQPSDKDLELLNEEAQRKRAEETGQTNYFTVIQLPQRSNKADSIGTAINSMDSTQIVALQNLKESTKLDSASTEEQLIGLRREFNDYEEVRSLAMSDTIASEEVRQIRINNIANEQAGLGNQIDSLEAVQNRNLYSLDSINQSLLTQAKLASSTDSTSIPSELNEILIYPGQVTRVVYGEEQPTEVILDSTSVQRSSSEDMMSREQFDEELEKFREDMLQAQATRDSAMMMAFAAKLETQPAAQTTSAEEEPQEIVVTQEGIDEDTRKKIEKNNEKARKAEEKAARRQERLEEKNNDLLEDALLVGGTAAATAAITSGGKKDAPTDSTLYQPDSVLLARIASDSLLIDSLRNAQKIIDTVRIEKTNPLLLKSSKVEVYFGINETKLSEEEMEKLQPIASYLKENPEAKLELIGFADNTGPMEYNLMISNQRVDEVFRVFNEDLGIESNRMIKEVGGLILRGSQQSKGQDRKVEIRLYQE